MFIDDRSPYTPGSSKAFDALPRAISTEEILSEQRVDSFCQTALANVGKKSSYLEDNDGVLRRRLPFSEDL